MLPSQPTRFTEGRSGPRTAYWAFYRKVASAQLAAWLPARPSRVLDLSGEHSRFTMQMAAAGHEVIKAVEGGADPIKGGGGGSRRSGGSPVAPPRDVPGEARRDSAREAREEDLGEAQEETPREPASPAGPGAGRVRLVTAERVRLSFLADACVDAVLAEGRVLSFSIATETTVEDAARVLRPGGRMLVCVDSLVAGMSRLAEQKCWAELCDAPSADVLLVPSPDGRITRCFWPEQLREVLTDAGLEVEWVRPRTVLSPSMVERALEDDPGALPALVEAELALACDHADESVGIRLVASARRPAVPASRHASED